MDSLDTGSMTKILIATILLFGFKSETSLPTIEIITVSMDILTSTNVECSEFEKAFQNQRKFRTLRSQKKIDRFLNELKNLKKFDDKTDMDTRAQILIKYKDHTDEICADRFSIYRDGTCYVITDKLKKLIW